jgi:hypothetical protein
MAVTWSLNSDVMAAMRTPMRPNKGLISTGSANSFQYGMIARILWSMRTIEGALIKDKRLSHTK